MSFNGSKVQLDFEEGSYTKGQSKNKLLAIAVFVVVFILAIVFLILFIRSEQKIDEAVRKAKEEFSRGAPPSSQNPIETTSNPSQVTTASNPPQVTTTINSNLPHANIRLPNYVIPELYEIYLDVDMEERTVTGNTTIAISVSKPTKYIIVHATGYLELTGDVKKKNSLESLKTVSRFSQEQNQYYVLQLENELDMGSYQLEYKFNYQLKNNLKGFYISSYNTSDGEKFVAATQFEPVDARAAFPCFDEPAMKAKFQITISHDDGYFAISNMPIKRKWYDGTNWISVFEQSPMMPTYLVAFVVCDFANKTVIAKGNTNVSMTFYAPRDQIDQIDHAMDVGSKILPFFEQYYNVSYPLQKADMIAIPDFAAGAMENWGLITYRTNALLYDKDQSGISNKQYVSSVVSHELAHQWFGNIVTMDWWSDLWLNEGFASYVEYLGMNVTENWNVLDFIVINDVSQALGLDALVTSHPVYVEVNHPDDISEIFDAISYQKGGAILLMLDDLLGPGVFVKGLNIYLNKHSYKNAKTNDLWKSLSEASKLFGNGKNVSRIMNTWIMQMGFPVVDVVSTDGGSFSLSQSRFLRDPNPDLSKSKYSSPYNYTWVIPFNYMLLDISNISNPRVIKDKATEWMEFGSASIKPNVSSKDILIKGNAGQYGFFRVNYDTKEWGKIIKVLNSNHQVFDVKDRAGLLGDAFELAYSGRLNYTTALNLFDYIGKEKDYLPWKAAIDSITFLPAVLTPTKPALNFYRQFMLKKVSPLYEKYRFNDTGNILERYLQMLIVSQACANGHKECIDSAKSLFQKYMSNPDVNPIPSDFRSLVYYYGVHYGGEKEWNFLFDRYLKNKIASEKTKLMYGLSATQEPWMLNRWLKMGLNDRIVKSQDVSFVFSYVATSNPIGSPIAWCFMKDNWETIQGRFAQSFFTIRRIFSSVTSKFTTKYELDEMNEFINTKVTNPGTAKRIISQSIEKITANIEWLTNNEKTVEQWLFGKV